MPVTPLGVPKVPKRGFAYDPQELVALGAGTGPVNTNVRHGAVEVGPVAAGALMMGVAGGGSTGAQTADGGAGVTLFPSQFCFPVTKYRREAGW